MLESEFTVDELYDAMMTLRRGKCPGVDGLGLEFYHKFWNEIKHMLFRLYKFCFAKKQTECDC